jgi:hypothetical protein
MPPYLMMPVEEPVQKWFSGFWNGSEFDPNKIFTSLATKYRDSRPYIPGKLFFGSFHVCLRVVFNDGVDWIVRVPLLYWLL